MPSKSSKFSYTSPKQVTIKPPKPKTTPKPSKFSYTSKNQVKVTKPAKQKTESLSEVARVALFELNVDKLTLVNPKTKHRIKVLSALGYDHSHPAYKAAIALLKKKKVTVPGNVHATKPGETIPMFGGQFEPRSSNTDVMSGEDLKEHLMEHQKSYWDGVRQDYEVFNTIETYMGAGYLWINGSLRDTGDYNDAIRQELSIEMEDGEDEDDYFARVEDYVQEKINTDVDNMISAFSSDDTILTKDIVTYRGVNADSLIDEITSGGVGTIIEDAGFVSTSIDLHVAHQFASDDGIILKVISKAGTRALYPNAGIESSLGDEQEVILNKDSKFRVVNISKEKMPNPKKFGAFPSVRTVVQVETILNEEDV